MSVDPMPRSGVASWPDGLDIVPMVEADLDAVLAIEREAFLDPWPRRFFVEELTKIPPAYARVARLGDGGGGGGGELVGYLVAWFILDEVHLGNLAVEPGRQRHGIGRALVEHLVERAERRGASFITLEVRAGNRAAITLYTRHRFKPVGIRRGYYAGREDAIIMVREFGHEGGGEVEGERSGGPPPVEAR